MAPETQKFRYINAPNIEQPNEKLSKWDDRKKYFKMFLKNAHHRTTLSRNYIFILDKGKHQRKQFSSFNESYSIICLLIARLLRQLNWVLFNCLWIHWKETTKRIKTNKCSTLDLALTNWRRKMTISNLSVVKVCFIKTLVLPMHKIIQSLLSTF